MKLVLALPALLVLAAALRADVPTAAGEEPAVPSLHAPGDAFGSAVDTDGDVSLVGAPLADPLALPDAGAATVFRRGPTGWSEEATLIASDAAAGGELGSGVAVEGDTALVGAWRDDGAGLDAGAVYAFARAGSAWVETQKLVASDAAPGDGFGCAVALDGDTLVVGARFSGSPGASTGAAYVFVRAGTTWTQQAKLVAPDAGVGDELGFAVALDGGTALVGAPGDDPAPGANNGSAYVFVRSGTTWSFQGKLRQGSTNDRFGSGVALDGDRALCGGRGVAFVFAREGAVWSEVQRLFWWDQSLASEGLAVALQADTALVGAPEESGGGTVLIYRELQPGPHWRPETRFSPAGSAAGDRFGGALALAGGRALVGAPAASPAGTASGAAFHYRIARGEVCVTETQLLADPAPGPDDGLFGTCVAVSGDTIAVGSASSTPGITASAFVFVREPGGWAPQAELTSIGPHRAFAHGLALQHDTLAVAYEDGDAPVAPSIGADVFVRSGTQWSPEARVAIDAGPDDHAYALALDEDTLAIGTPSDDAVAPDAGAVRVFVRSGTTWSLQATLNASNAASDSAFGRSLALEGDLLLVGAHSFSTLPMTGWAYVFRRNRTSWVEEARLDDPAGGFTRFGEAVALARTTAAVGAPGYHNGADSVWTFARSGTSWSLEARVPNPEDVGSSDTFGAYVALDGARLVVSDPRDAGIGAAWVYARSGTSWLRQQKLIPGDVGTAFPWTVPFDVVALDGDVVVVGRGGKRSAYVYELERTFPSFCDASDGALAACPCANPGAPDAGCDLPQATGGVRLDVLAQRRTPVYRATLTGSGYPPANAPTVIAIRSAVLDPSSPLPLGDGLRCVGLPLVRLGATTASAGTSIHALDHPPAMAGAFHYQLWFRSTPAMYCTPDAFNVSSGRTLRW